MFFFNILILFLVFIFVLYFDMNENKDEIGIVSYIKINKFLLLRIYIMLVGK